jgi:hypothetical protein
VNTLLASGGNSLLSNGEGLVVLGILGLVAAFFGQERFRPLIHGAQYGRWRACHWMRFPLLAVGGAGLVMLVAAKA